MTNLEELIETANRLSDNLEKAAQEESRFGIDLCCHLEQMAWSIYCTMNEIKQIKDYYV